MRARARRAKRAAAAGMDPARRSPGNINFFCKIFTEYVGSADCRVAYQGTHHRSYVGQGLPDRRLDGTHPRPADRSARDRSRARFRPAVRGYPPQPSGGEKPPRGGGKGRRHLPRPRPGPRRRSDRVALGKRLEEVHQGALLPRDVPRDHPLGHRAGAEQQGQRQHRSRRRPAGAPRPRPAGRLSGEPAALAQARKGQQRGPGAVGGAAVGRRTRTRDRRLHPRGVLELHPRPQDRRGPAPARQAGQGRRTGVPRRQRGGRAET